MRSSWFFICFALMFTYPTNSYSLENSLDPSPSKEFHLLTNSDDKKNIVSDKKLSTKEDGSIERNKGSKKSDILNFLFKKDKVFSVGLGLVIPMVFPTTGSLGYEANNSFSFAFGLFFNLDGKAFSYKRLSIHAGAYSALSFNNHASSNFSPDLNIERNYNFDDIVGFEVGLAYSFDHDVVVKLLAGVSGVYRYSKGHYGISSVPSYEQRDSYDAYPHVGLSIEYKFNNFIGIALQYRVIILSEVNYLQVPVYNLLSIPINIYF